MKNWLVAALHLLAFVSWTVAKSSTGDSVLVLLEKDLPKERFSKFFSGLEGRGYELTFRDPKEPKPPIMEDDVPKFSHVIVFAPTTKAYSPELTPQTFVSLLTKNVNVIFALSTTQTPLTSLAAEFSLIPAPPGTPLISHFPKRDLPATTIPITVPSSPLLTPNTPPVLFSGTPHAFGLNPLLVPILHAPPESFATDTESDSGADAILEAAERGGEGLWAGSQLGVVTGFQTRNNARALWVGGVDLFTDDFANKEVSKGVKSGNAQFAQDVAAWTFQESLVLRIDSTSHHKVNETEPPEHYTINDQAVYTAHISKYDPKSATWQPYSGITDMQLEFTMLDPHIRTALPPVPGRPGEYSVSFRVPDRHGVFKFVLDYKRKGWTYLVSTSTVPVVPPRHDEYPRFLSAAWPYYVGAISTSAGFVLFCTLWLAGDVREKKGLKDKAGKNE